MASQSRAQRRKQTARQQQQRSPKQQAQSTNQAVVPPTLEPEIQEAAQSDPALLAESTDATSVSSHETVVLDPPAPRASTAPAARAATSGTRSGGRAGGAHGRAGGARVTRRARPQVEHEPVDYSKDYASVRHDLIWIAIWATLLMAVMIGLRIANVF